MQRRGTEGRDREAHTPRSTPAPRAPALEQSLDPLRLGEARVRLVHLAPAHLRCRVDVFVASSASRLT
eukprot:6196586-Pleurochrysis_carterae.AAC.7